MPVAEAEARERIERYQAREPLRVIAEDLGLSVSGLNAWLSQHTTLDRRRTVSDEDACDRIHRYEAGEPVESIAADHGITSGALCRWMWRNAPHLRESRYVMHGDYSRERRR